ncbi:MAG: DEAD/DEAH box helicase, partial [bacterium]
MSNVPPHPANYLQRTGRAGRRGETQALSFTLCKDNPHELGVFHNPLWPFTTAIAAPDIALNSRVIVQRHLNSLLLSAFLNKLSKQQEQSLLSMNCQNFFYEPVNNKHPAVDLFIKQLTNYKNQGLPERLDQGFNHVRKNTILENSSIANIVQESIRLMEMLKGQWQRAFQQLLNEAEKCKSQKHDPYKNKIEHDLKQMGNAYLLSELASRSYLPGYGFPVGLASFDHYSVTDYKKSRYGANNKNRDDNLSRMRDRPTRNMAIAIREFSPGADVVLDGLVYHSAGLMLDPLLSESGSRSQKIMLQWRCHKCGGMGQTLAEGFDKKCTHCQEQLISDNVINYIE